MFIPCRYHKWVSEEALLEACFIGIVAAQQEDSEAVTADADPATAPRTVLSGGRNAGRRMRIAWDETNLAANDSELGLLRFLRMFRLLRLLRLLKVDKYVQDCIARARKKQK